MSVAKRPEYLMVEGREGTLPELVDEIERIRHAMEFYGLTPIGYDPGVVAYDTENPSRPSVDVPTWFLRRMVHIAEMYSGAIE